MDFKALSIFFISIIISGCASTEDLKKAIALNDVKAAEDLVEGHGINPYKVDESGNSPLETALENNRNKKVHRWAVSLLNDSSQIAKELYHKIKRDQLPLEKFRAQIVNPDFYLDAPVSDNADTLLIKLSKSEDYEEYVKALISAGASVDVKNQESETALFAAVRGNVPSITSILLNQHADPNSPNQDGNTPLHILLDNKEEYNKSSLKIAKMLLESGGSINLESAEGRSPLDFAAKNGDQNHIKLLLNFDPSPENLERALYIAMFQGDVDVLHLVLKEIEKRSIPLKYSPIPNLASFEQKGSRSNDLKILDLLRDFDFDLNAKSESGKTALFISVKNDNQAMVSRLLEMGADVDLRSENGWAPIHKAVFDGNIELINILLGAEPDLAIELASEKGWAPLHFTTNNPQNGDRSNDVTIAKRLIDAGAQVDKRSKEGKTPLYLASANNRPKLLEYLLSEGANPNKMSNSGWSPISEAITNNNKKPFDVLIEHPNVDLNEIGAYGWSYFHFTANNWDHGDRGNDLYFAKRLWQNGAEIDIKSDDGNSALIVAIKNERYELAKRLINYGANPNIKTERQWSPLMIAVVKPNLDVAKFLMRNGADVNDKNDEGNTPLHLISAQNYGASAEKTNELIQMLIRSGANVNALNHELRSPLMVAAEHGNTAAIKSLLRDKRTRTFIFDKNGMSPERIAIYNGNGEAAMLIKEHRM